MTDVEAPPLFPDLEVHRTGLDDVSGTVVNTCRATITARQVRRFTGVIQGPTNIVVDAIIAAGVCCNWDGKLRAYTVPLRVLDRVLTEVERAGYRVDYRTALW